MEQSTLTGAGFPDQGQALSAGNFEVEVGEDNEVGVAGSVTFLQRDGADERVQMTPLFQF
jgi:hypothetical protein